jgi:hypothetical protein
MISTGSTRPSRSAMASAAAVLPLAVGPARHRHRKGAVRATAGQGVAGKDVAGEGMR